MRSKPRLAGHRSSGIFGLLWRRARGVQGSKVKDIGVTAAGFPAPNGDPSNDELGSTRLDARLEDAQMRRKQVAAEFIQRAVAAVRRPEDLGARSQYQSCDRENITGANTGRGSATSED